MSSRRRATGLVQAARKHGHARPPRPAPALGPGTGSPGPSAAATSPGPRGRVAITAAAFALSAGLPADAHGLVHVDPATSSGRRLLVAVEPLEPSGRGVELAALALTTLREAFAAAPSLSPEAALTRAFAAANAVLLNENRPLAGCRWERRLYVGATAIVVAGHALTIAQVPPTQAMIVQDGHLYAIPDLASWRSDYVPPSDEAEPEPLGCREGTRPLLFSTVAAPNDLVILCSTTIARHLGRDDPAAVEPLRGGDPDLILEHLGWVAAVHELDDAHAAAVALRRLGRGNGLARLGWPRSDRFGATWPVVTPRLPAIGGRPRPVVPFGQHGRAMRGGVGFGQGRGWAGVGVSLAAPTIPWPTTRHGSAGAASGGRARPAGAIARIQLGLVELAEWLGSRREPAGIGFAARQQALAAPGATSVHRYRGEATFPVEWRANLPRGPVLRVPGRLLTIGVIAFLTFGGSGFALDHRRDRIARAEAALATVDGSLQALAADPGAADTALAEAEAALAAAHQAGAAAQTIAERTRALESARDRAWGSVRLTELTRIGALPEQLTGGPVGLVRAGRDVYLVGGGLYGLDGERRRLVQLLAPGTTVDGGVVGTLHTAAVDGGRLFATDGAALYARDGAGRWQRRSLALGDPRPALPIAAFQGSVYAIADGQIVKFLADDRSAPPLPWAAAGDFPELALGRDLVIDGRVHVLLADGQVVTFFRGSLAAAVTPAVTPPVAEPVVLAGGPDANFLYIVDTGVEIGSTAGRIVRLDAAGGARQILPPVPIMGDAASEEAARALADARDLVIDEEAALVYFVTSSDIWRATLPQTTSA